MSKRTKSHTTFIDSKILLKFLDYFEKSENVKSYTAGIIIPKKKHAKSESPVKVVLTENSILLKANTKSASQEVRVYGNGLEEVVKALEKLNK